MPAPDTKLVLLPGLDGTGRLFQPLLDVLATLPIATEVIALSDPVEGSPRVQAANIAAKLAGENVVLFAESYSGAIAYELCQLPQLNISHVIFSASFLSRPTVTAWLASHFPVALVRDPPVSERLLASWLFGDSDRTDLVRMAKSALATVSDAALSARLGHIAAMRLPGQRVNIPSTYIRPTRDLLVGAGAMRRVGEIYSGMHVVEVTGGHFIAQFNPQACTRIISHVFAL